MIFLQHEKGWDNMLTKTRQKEILKLLENRGSVTLQELKDHLNTSESTIRRDLNTLDAQGKLVKVFGGAVAADNMSIRDEQVSRREEKNLEEKRLIARYAASLIQDDDFVYLDAGTTTGCMLDYISDTTTAVFVTNAPSHAQKLARKGMEVILIGGRLKQSTEAVVGEEADRLKNLISVLVSWAATAFPNAPDFRHRIRTKRWSKKEQSNASTGALFSVITRNFTKSARSALQN